MRNSGLNTLFIGIALAVVAGAVDQTPKIITVPVKLSGTIDGAQLYREHCAVCHGVDAKGNGPAAAALKRPPSDLTQISSKNAGKFPEIAVKLKIKNGEVREHGTVEMPMWGILLTPNGHSSTDAEMRILALLQYLQKIQAQ